MTARVDEKTQFVDVGGEPIVNGFIYIGVQNADPKISSISIFSDRALTVSLANPQRTDSQGRSVNKIWFNGRYSIKVEDVNNVQQFQDLDAGEAVGSQTLPLINVLGTNAITADASPTITTLTDKSQFILQIVSENSTDAVTLAIDLTGAKAIKRNFDQDVGKGKFKVGQTVIVAYNLTADNFQWVNENARVFFQTKGADIVSAATIDLSIATGNYIHITGNTGPVTSFGTVLAGVEFILVFDSTPTVDNGANILMPNSANRIMAAGDMMHLASEGAGVFRVLDIMPADGQSILLASQAEAEAGTENTKTMTPLRTDQALENRIASGGISQTDVGTAAIGQGELITSTGDMTVQGVATTLVTGPGGEYGFWPTLRAAASQSNVHHVAPLVDVSVDPNTTFLQRFHISAGDGGVDLILRERFIQASPPYDMGDGDVISFIFAIVNNSTGLIEVYYHAPDPPWANNGPTNIRPDRIDSVTGKMYRTIKTLGSDLTLMMKPDFIRETEVEITAAFKNSDMGLIPHPFLGNDLTGKTIVLFDPMSPIVERLEDIKNADGDPSEIISGGYLKISNEELNRARPPGVMSVSVSMK